MATASQSLVGDEQTIHDFLSQYLRTGIQLVAIEPHTRGVEANWFGDRADMAAEWALRQNMRGRGVYFSVNVVRAGLGKKAEKQDVVEARMVHVDIDPQPGVPFDMEAVLGQLDGLTTPPSWVIASGGGVGAYWVLDEPSLAMDMIESINMQVRQFFNADACHNIDRIMRVPGTINFPNAKKAFQGRQAALAHIAREDDGVVYRADVLAASFPEVQAPSARSTASVHVGPYALITANDLELDELSPLRSLIEHPRGADRSKDVYSCAGAMRRAGFSPAQILGIIMNPANAVSQHILEQRDPRYQALRCIEGTADGGHAEPRRSRQGTRQAEGESVAATSDRPVIHVGGGDLYVVASAAERVLIETGAPLYVRNGLVRPIVDEIRTTKGYTAKVARLKSVDADTLVDRLSRAADWTKFDGRSRDTVAIDPPSRVASTILAREGEWSFSRLTGVITTPTLRPDGTILAEPGYDAATQLLLLEPPALPKLPEKPTHADAMAALQQLDGLLDEFPFVDDASRSVALSGMITLVLRGALETAPMHATTAPVRGSGKSYIIDIIAAISTGQRAPVISIGKTEEETEKRVTGCLLTGQTLIAIDNVNGQLGGDFLCQAIERPLVDVRPLGGSVMVKISSRATFVGTGNNMQLLEDMTRRVVLCSLDPEMERPEFRDFKGNPLERVLADRGTYIAAALTIVRAYVLAGRPGVCPRLASFEEWSDNVRSALVWLGRADPVETMDKANAEDPGRVALSGLLNAWYDAVNSATHTTATIKAKADTLDPIGNRIYVALADALQDVGSGDNGAFSTKRLGRYLGRNHGRIVDGLKLIAGEDTHAKQKTWKVVRV